MQNNTKKHIEMLKKHYNVKTYKDLAKVLDISKSAIDQWIRTKNVPEKYLYVLHEETPRELNIGYDNPIDFLKILNDKKLEISEIKNQISRVTKLNELSENDIKNELISVIKQLDSKRAEYYLYKIKAELLEQELEK